jgi:hypothetical protein
LSSSGSSRPGCFARRGYTIRRSPAARADSTTRPALATRARRAVRARVCKDDAHDMAARSPRRERLPAGAAVVHGLDQDARDPAWRLGIHLLADLIRPGAWANLSPVAGTDHGAQRDVAVLTQPASRPLRKCGKVPMRSMSATLPVGRSSSAVPRSVGSSLRASPTQARCGRGRHEQKEQLR